MAGEVKKTNFEKTQVNYIRHIFSHHCVVPENIYTLTTEGIGNSWGRGRVF